MLQSALLAEARPSVRMTLEQWASMPEDEPGELVDGQLVEEEMAGYAHEVVVAWLIRMLGNWLAGTGGLVAGSAAKFAVRPTRGRVPDLSMYLAGSRKPPRTGLIRFPADVLIEVVSPSPKDARRDRVEKLGDYAAFGVRWYWIVDPQLRTFEVFELGADQRYVHALGAGEGVVAAVPGCEGLSLDLDALWGEIDQLGPDEEESEGE